MRIVVVGGVAAGMSAASQARRRDPTCEVVVIERGRDIAYSACGMPYNIADPQRTLDDLVILDASTARRERGIDLRTRHDATSIDLARRALTVRDLDGERSETLHWDRLVLATGARALRPALPGIDAPDVFVLRDLADANAIKQHLNATRVGRAVVVGAGYIGIEMADALHDLGVEVEMLEKAPQALPGYAPEIVAAAMKELQAKRVALRTGVGLASIERGASGDLLVRGDDGSVRSAQLVVVAIGVRPEVSLAAQAGIRLGASGAIATDHHMRTSASGVFACGDCAEAWHLVLGRPAWIPLGPAANKQGKVAGANAVSPDGDAERFDGIVGSAGFKLFGLEVARTGLGAAEIASAGLDAVSAVSHHHTRARSYPGDRPITTVLFAERGSSRLLGAQMIGGEAVAKRIDIFATALHARMTLEQVEALDLTYAPPFAPVYDPVLIAATVGLKALAARR